MKIASRFRLTLLNSSQMNVVYFENVFAKFLETKIAKNKSNTSTTYTSESHKTFGYQICTRTRSYPIRTLHVLDTLFWLVGFRVRVQNSYSKVILQLGQNIDQMVLSLNICMNIIFVYYRNSVLDYMWWWYWPRMDWILEFCTGW